jgi:hypothetical protein
VLSYRIYLILLIIYMPSDKTLKNSVSRKTSVSQLRSEVREIRKNLKSQKDRSHRLKLEVNKVKLANEQLCKAEQIKDDEIVLLKSQLHEQHKTGEVKKNDFRTS